MKAAAKKTFRLAGLRCSCPPNCTETHWGNGPRDCDPECEPCKIMKGKKYEKL